MPPAPERRYASLARAAQYADCHERTLRRHIAAGDLSEYRLGRVVRVDLNEIDAWLAGEHIKKLVADAPELTQGQLSRIAGLLAKGGGDNAA